MSQILSPPPLTRKYDKGERRHKHEWGGSYPIIEFDKKRPRRWVGKCPATMPAELRQSLLNEAIAGPKGDRDIDYDKYLYVVHEGAIYEARTSDGGKSYHGFPYRGKLAKQVVEALRAQAKTKGCLETFEGWIKSHCL